MLPAVLARPDETIEWKRMMEAQHLFEELVRVAEKLGVEVRVELFETPASEGGGLCILRGEHLVLLDARAPLEKQTLALAQALSTFETEIIYMAPEARAFLEGSGFHGVEPAD